MATLPDTHAPLPKVDAPPALAERYDRVYREAQGRAEAVPWHRGGPDPLLLDWLNTAAPGVLRPGARCVVVGCGLADDADEMVRRGYDALGFDAAPTAIEWAARRHPHLAGSLRVACVTAPPIGLLRRFDLVAECRTLQSIEPERRHLAMRGIASLCRPHGLVVVVASTRDPADPPADAPPYPLTDEEVCALAHAAGLAAVDGAHLAPDPVGKGRAALRRVFRPAQSTR